MKKIVLVLMLILLPTTVQAEWIRTLSCYPPNGAGEIFVNGGNYSIGSMTQENWIVKEIRFWNESVSVHLYNEIKDQERYISFNNGWACRNDLIQRKEED